MVSTTSPVLFVKHPQWVAEATEGTIPTASPQQQLQSTSISNNNINAISTTVTSVQQNEILSARYMKESPFQSKLTVIS